MARLAPEEGFALLKDQVAETVKEIFPIKGTKHTLRLDDIEVKDNKDIEDIRSQKKARLEGRTWSVPVNGKLSLVDNKTGKVVDRRTQRIMSLPKVTNRHSYIVDGQEYQMDNQWQLKPGVYSRRDERGELESMFNLKGKHAFKVKFDPKTAKFSMLKGTTNVPLYPIMRELGVTDEDLEKSWGKQILQSNKVKSSDAALERFYKAVNREKPSDPRQAREFLQEFMDGAKMDPDVARITLGDKHDTVGGKTIQLASQKLLGISRGDVKPDARDSLMFKNFRSTEDFAREALQTRSGEILRRVGNNLDRKGKIQEIVGPDIFNRPINALFKKANLSNRPDQTNPLEMISGAMKTTIMGEGGITSEHKITEDAKLIDPSHLGFLDPIHTPESARTGVSLHLPLGARKKGNKLVTKMYNIKTGKMEDVDPETAYNANIVLPDQVKWRDGKPVPIGKTVKFSGQENEITTGSMKGADYVMPAPAQLFSVASNMIPFLQNDSGNRATYASKQMEQAIPLKHRESPLVQTVIAAGKKETSLNKFMGKINSHTTPIDGEVVQVKSDSVVIKGADGKRKEVQTYDHFPLNDDKSFLHSTPLVKVGDKVKKGQTVADTNFTKKGDLALGSNLTTAYVPFHGYNYEDGVVISESGAKQLTSEHMHRKGLDVGKEHTLSKDAFLKHYGMTLKKDQADKLDDAGVIKKGQRVGPGDTLVAALRHREETDEDKIRRRMHKSLVKPYDNVSVTWDNDHPGVVTNVVKRGKRAEVHVRTEEPAEIGDKISGRHGDKGIITRIVPDHEMPTTKDGKRVHLALNPAGVAGRINLGQVLEAAAGKIAEKTGKPYRVQNFDGTEDMTERVQKELKEHGLSDKEELIDPKTGKTMGRALVGPRYMHKLRHQVGKKLVARAGGPDYAYDMNRIPKRGGPHGAQALDSLGVYAMLASGAKANLREMQTYKSNAENNDELWSAVQTGDPLPAPRPSFAYNKFVGMLKTIGVNTVKQGNTLNLMPLTDKQVREMSEGRTIKDAGKMVLGKNLKEEKGGIFDKDATGGLNGTKWSHIELPERMPNPIFEKAIVSLTGIKKKDLGALMDGSKALNTKTGQFTSPEEGVSAGKAVEHLLKKIDVDAELASAQKQIQNPSLKGDRLDKVNKKIKYLRSLKKLGMTPTEAYMTKTVPVLPPSMRPLAVRPNGELGVEDLNGMYKGLGIAINKMKDASPLQLPEKINKRRAAIYDAMKGLAGTGGYLNRDYRGVLDIIAGKKAQGPEGKPGSPRESYFQSKLIKRKQDLSMRSTIIPEPELGLDEVGIPRKAAMEMYKPFIVRELGNFAGLSPLAAQQAIKDRDPLAARALERVVKERPVMLKRDPVLHKYGVQAFKPVLTSGKAIKIHPLVTGGFNADFDGNCVDGCSELVIRCSGLAREHFMKFGAESLTVARDPALGINADRIMIKNFPREEEPHRYDRNGAAVYRVPDGLQVLSYDHFLGESTFEDVTELTIEEDCPVVEVRYASGHKVTASTNESLCVYDHETGMLRKARPEESVGALSPVISSPPGDKHDKFFGWMVGAFVSDGFFTNGRIGITKVDDEFRSTFGDALRTFGDVYASNTYRREKKAPTDFSEHSVKDHYTVGGEIKDLFMRCYTVEYRSYLRDGTRSGELKNKRAALYKRLPQDIGDYSRDALLGVLSGLLDGDGTLSWSRSKTKEQFLASYSTSSHQLMEDVRYLCHLLNVRCSVSPVYPRANRAQRHINYVISFSTVDIEKLAGELRLAAYSDTLIKLAANPLSKDDRDVVPVPISILRGMISKKSVVFKKDPKLCRSLATLASKNKRRPRVSRDTALRMVPYLNLENALEAYWSSLVKSDVRWSYVKEVEDKGKTTVYDLVVPTTKIFAVNGGLVVWDTMAAFVPLTSEAVDEARKMYPSRNLFSPATGSLMYKPTKESQLGLYKLTQQGKRTDKAFKTVAEAARAASAGSVGMTDVVKIGGQQTTIGRALVANALPQSMRGGVMSGKTPLDGKGQTELLTRLAKDHKGSFGEVVNKIKDLGNSYATQTASSLGLEDLRADKKLRDRILKSADAKVKEIMSGKGTKEQKQKKAIQIYDKASEAMIKAAEIDHAKNPTELFQMLKAGIKPQMGAYRQITMAPMLMMNAKGKVIPDPIRKSYSEGIDVGDYWTQMSGARKGVVQKVQSVQEPGYFTKQVINSVMNNAIGEQDCGTKKGITLPIEERDVLDRYLAKDTKSGRKTFKAGTLITPGVRDSLRNNRVGRVVVRSPLRCEHSGTGICARCYGNDEDGAPPPTGRNVGIISAQAIGERATQLAMRTFHEGGVAPVGAAGKQKAALTDEFNRVQQLVQMHQNIPGSAPLSSVNGRITKIQKDPAGGSNVFISAGDKEVRHYVPQNRGEPLTFVGDRARKLTRGMQIQKGAPLSAGPINPNELLPLAGVNKVQGYLAGQMYDLYKQQGIRRRNIETVVKSMTNLTKVSDPGGQSDFIRGDFAPTSKLQALNKKLVAQGKKPIAHRPVLKGVKTLPLDMQTDWMARLNHEQLAGTVVDAANQGWSSNIHGEHPIPALAYAAEFGKKKPY